MSEIDFANAPVEVIRALEDRELATIVQEKSGPESVYAWAKLGFRVEPALHHKEWVEQFFAELRTIRDSWPESAKTTWAEIICSWWIGKYPWTVNMVLSNSEEVAADIAALIAEKIESSPQWKLAFPGVIPDAKHWSREGYRVVDVNMDSKRWARLTATRKDPTLCYGGVGSKSVNGKRVSGVLVFDDLHDDKSAESEIECARVVKFFRRVALRRLTKKARAWGNQTRWSPKDVIAWIESVKEKYKFHVFHTPPVKKNGEAVWPEVWPLERLETEHAGMTEDEWQLIFMGNAEASRGQLLKKEYLRDYDHKNIMPHWTRYIGVDFSQKLQELTSKQEAKHSHFAVAVLVHTGNFLVLEDGFDGILYGSDAEETFFSIADLYKQTPLLAGIETNAQNRAFYNNLLRRKIASGRTWLSLVPVETSKNMGVRMSEMEPDFRLGAIQVSDSERPALKVFRDEWVGFGIQGVHDDMLSAVHLARDMAYNLLPTQSHVERNRLKTKSPFAGIGRMNV